MMTRIVLKMLLSVALILPGAAGFAAPPRFSTYGGAAVPSQPVSQASGASEEPQQAAASTSDQIKNDPVSTAPETQPEMKIEFIDGKLIRTPDAANTKRTNVDETAKNSESTNPSVVATENVPAPPAQPVTRAAKKRGPLIQLGKHKPYIPKEKTYKTNEELITTSEYHESDIDKLGIADTHRFVPGLNEFWKVNTSKVMCTMQQEIPGYGHVEFRQGVGQPLEFALYVTYPPAGIGRAHIRTEPPEWRHYSQAKDLGVIEIEPGDLAVSTSPDWANRLLLELREGMQPVMRYWDAADATDNMEVLISSLNFQHSLNLFNRCLGQVLRYDFDAVKRTIVHFHEDSSKLRTKAMRQLDEVLEILKEDNKVKEIDLELYTHSKGLVRYNFRLATRRARAVRDYFIKRGIPEDKIIIKIHTHKKSKLQSLGYKASDVHIVLRRNQKSK
ncbi:MAG: OmpA family protein [Thioalkalispiraceae bacterium]|jgi:outer membrane protein OmpA-like peptidoglycan-associated protein